MIIIKPLKKSRTKSSMLVYICIKKKNMFHEPRHDMNHFFKWQHISITFARYLISFYELTAVHWRGNKNKSTGTIKGLLHRFLSIPKYISTHQETCWSQWIEILIFYKLITDLSISIHLESFTSKKKGGVFKFPRDTLPYSQVIRSWHNLFL